MAIEFQAPGAVSNISEEYGRLQQNNLRAEFSLKQEEAKAAASARAQANANQVSQMNAQVNMAEESNRVHVAESQARMNESMNERLMSADNQANLQERSQNFQREQRQQDFSYADSIRLQNLQQGKAYIASEVDNGNISMEEANTMLTQLDGRVGALQFAQTQTQQRHQRQQDEIQAHQAAQMATRASRDAVHYAKTLNERTSVMLDPNIEAEVRARLDPNGDANEDDAGFNARVAREVRLQGGATRVLESAPGHVHVLESARAGQQGGEVAIPPATMHAIRAGVERQVDRELERNPTVPDDFARLRGETEAQRRARYRNDLIQERTNEHIQGMGGAAGGRTSGQAAAALNDLAAPLIASFERNRNQPAAPSSPRPIPPPGVPDPETGGLPMRPHWADRFMGE